MSIEKYTNRYEAGKILAESLRAYRNHKNSLVLALPRGGVPVAYEVANALGLPLDVFIVRKLGVPGHRELAMGAIAMGGTTVFNEEIVKELQISKFEMDEVIAEEAKELRRREITYRGDKPFPELEGKTIILVDDGIATGATMRSAIMAIKNNRPAKLIVAVPVAEKFLSEKIAKMVDEFYCPMRPTHFYAVGAWYDDFSQTEDEEVFTLLKAANTK